MNVLEEHNLKKKFGSSYVVKDVFFEIKNGEVFGFLGKNGAGKTTTINMLTGITSPTEGSFTILGNSHTNINSVKKCIGVMPDAANYYYDMTALGHLTFFSELKNIKWSKKELIYLLESVGLSGQDRKKLGTFSFGMKKKLGIAQALIGEPELIFLDEPTSGLDPESAVVIQELIRALSPSYYFHFSKKRDSSV